MATSPPCALSVHPVRVLRLLLVVCALATTATAGSRARAIRRAGPIAIDGRLDEVAWSAAPVHTGFTQRFPKDGVPAALATKFAVLYDDTAVYVGVWADDPEPARIRRLLTRRDVDVLADAVAVGIDSYQDRRTAYVFQLNAAGVQRDMLLFDDTKSDDTWDAVWTGDVAVTSSGWTAEFRIPLNQLRFATRDQHAWGLQVFRTVARTQEQAAWSPWPRSSDQTVSRFGVVDGIEKLGAARRVELLPYATGGIEANATDTDGRGNAGLDAELGIGPAFTLSATINPDFGQVEADPSQVNLSADELFFAERRPFFLEGVDLFKLPIGNGDNAVEGAFYSRRIGDILGAAKLTGKTSSGWSVGVLDAITGGDTPTNYAVARIKRDFNEGATMVGLSATSVVRLFDDPEVHDRAYTAGLQLQHRWADGAWTAKLDTVGSYVHGTTEAIAATQRSNRHLYQRPDATNAMFDPTRTSLSGVGATWQIGRLGDTKHWRYGTGGDLRTIGLELNDLGFQTYSDRAIPYIWAQVREDAPDDEVLNWQINADVYAVTTLEPRVLERGLECNASAQFANYWSLSGGCNIIARVADPVALRGGASLRLDPRAQGYVNLTTDTRKRLWLSLGAYGGREPKPDQIDGGLDLGATIQARSNVDLYVGPSIFIRNDPMQYVAETMDTTGTPHFVFARVRQRVTSMTIRVNWTFSPRLALQAYAQPFIATGRYSELKDVDTPGARDFADRFTPIHGTRYTLDDNVYSVRTDDGGTFQFERPDFAFRQLRSTVVLRWEYRPGSPLFAIWSHGRTSEGIDGRYDLGRDLDRLTDARGEDVVMLKLNYWLGL